MKVVTVGGVLLAVVTPLLAAYPGVFALDMAITFAIFATPAAMIFWFRTRSRFRALYPLRSAERPVVLSALALWVGVLGLATGLLAQLGFGLWALGSVALLVSIARWWVAARARRPAPDGPADELGRLGRDAPEPPFLGT